MRSAARSRAEAARGLPVTSSLSGRSAPLVSRRNCGVAALRGHGQAGRRLVGGQPHELPLDDAVLERVVGQHDDAAADGQHVQRGGQRPAQRAELVVHLDPQGLEGALGRVAAGAPGGRRDRVLDDRAQPLRRGDRGAGPLADHRVGDPPGEPLLAVVAQDPGEFGGRVAVDDVGGGAVLAAVHPHVERGVLGVGEAALGVVELRRGHAQVEQQAHDAVRPDGPGPGDGGHDGRDLVVPGVHQRDPGGVGGEQLAGRLDRGHVGVDADQQQAGAGLEQGAGVAGPAQRGVHEHGALGGQGGREQGGDTAGEHRYVLGPVHASVPLLLVCWSVPAVVCVPLRRPHPLALPAGTGEVMPAGSGGWGPARGGYRIPGSTSSAASANESSCAAR